MAKNIMLSFLSPLQGGDVKDYESLVIPYRLESGSLKEGCQTNEAPLYDVHEILTAKGEKLEAFFAFATDEVEKRFTLKQGEGSREFEGVLPFLRLRCLEQGIEFEHAETVPYDAKAANPVEESLGKAAAMARAIKAYLGGRENWHEAHIFVDITGGFRYANMIMMTVVRLLQYDGMQVEKIIYSEKLDKSGRVCDFQELNRLYSLTAGADAFVKYGRSQAIEEYFDFNSGSEEENGHLSTELRTLLQAMHDFSDSISLCRTSTLLKDMRKLREALDNYARQDHPVEEAAFAQLLDTIYREYDQILVKDIESYVPKMLDVIDWCLKKGFVQQALTLSNEWLPIYIVQMRICYPVDVGIKKSTSTLHHHWEQEFIINFIPPQKMVDGLAQTGQIIRALSEGRNPRIEEEGLPVKFISFLKSVDEVERLHRKFLTFGNIDDRGGLKYYIVQHEGLDRLLKFFYQHMPATYKKDYASFIHTYGYKRKLMVLLCGMGKKKWQELFLEKEEQPVIKPGPKKYWSDRERQWRNMFAAGIVESCVDTEEAIGLLYHHNKLRQLRHTTNHASEENNYTVETIRKAIASALADFYRVTRKMRADHEKTHNASFSE